MIFLGVKFFLPLLLTSVGSQTVQQWGNCQYNYYADKIVKDNAIVPPVVVDSFDSCLAQCVNHRRAGGSSDQTCNSFTYGKFTKMCFLHSQSSERLFNIIGDSTSTDTGSIISCGDQPDVNPPPPDVGAPPPDAATPPPDAGASQPVGGASPISRPSNNNCGRQESDLMPDLTNSLRVIRGQEAKPNSWPWMVNFGFGCGASLIQVREDLDSSDMVLTAAHCAGQIRNDLPVLAGIHDLTTHEATVAVHKIAEVILYDRNAILENDIALVRLTEPIRFTKTIKPVCLAGSSDPIPTDLTCVATGWGKTNDAQTLPTTRLMQATLRVQSNDTCDSTWRPNYNPSKHICAGDGITTLCKGDSGGPLMCKDGDGPWVQYGIASAVQAGGCANGNTPTLFARVQTFADWIQNQINQMSALLKR